MKIGLALGGGGAKGSYQIGVFQALRELEIKVDIVTGTSIGAINGCLGACDDFDTMHEFWSALPNDPFLKSLNFSDISLDMAFLQKHLKINDKKSYVSDNTQIRNLIAKYTNEEKIRKSKVNFGLVCVSFPTMKPVEVTLKDIKKGQLPDYLLASSSIFPAFPMCKIDENLYIDGGYFDNLPINLAVKMGADFIIAVDLFANFSAHPEYISSPLVKYVQTKWDLGQILSFKDDFATKNRCLGYNETMKAFGKYAGFKYTFSEKSLQNVNPYADLFAKNILILEATIPASNLLVRKIVSHPISKYIRESATENPSIEDFFVRGLEICMENLRFNPTVVYDLDDVNRKIIKIFSNKSKYKYWDLFKNINKVSMSIDKTYLIGCILYKILESDTFNDEIYILASIFPKETISALYVCSLMRFT
ncbi:MAG: patatin-like phospholipase family protein [Clostridia bacterium]